MQLNNIPIVKLVVAEIETAGETFTLQPLERVEATREAVLSRQRVFPPPSLLDPVDQRVFLAEGASGPDTCLRWARVNGAVRYRLQIARSTLFGDLLLDRADLHSSCVQLPGLPEGGYYWRVSALDGGDVESPFSETRKFRVAGAREGRIDDREPPNLQLLDFLPSGHLVIISGRTEPGAVLSVGGQAIDVYEDGAFTAVVRLKREGRNDLEIVAQDRSGNETRLRRAVFVESF